MNHRVYNKLLLISSYMLYKPSYTYIHTKYSTREKIDDSLAVIIV